MQEPPSKSGQVVSFAIRAYAGGQLLLVVLVVLYICPGFDASHFKLAKFRAFENYFPEIENDISSVSPEIENSVSKHVPP